MKKPRGATLLEILIAMVIIGMVAGGIMTAFVFSRRVSWRSSTELSAASFVQDVADGLRQAVNSPVPGGLTLAPGIYVDENMQNPPTGSTPLAVLNFPPAFSRFQTNPGTAPTLAGHGDGRLMVVERADENANGITDEDLDGDGRIGQDFDGDNVTDLRRVRIRVKWTTPES